MEDIEVQISCSEGLEVVGTPVARELAEGAYEVLAEVLNQGQVPLVGCKAFLIGKGELAQVLAIDEVELGTIAPGGTRPLRASVSARPDAIAFFKLGVVGKPVAFPPPVALPIFGPASMEVTTPMAATATGRLQDLPVTYHAAGGLVADDSARAVATTEGGASVYAEVSNRAERPIAHARLQAVGYDATGRIAGVAEAGPWPLLPGQVRAVHLVLVPLDAPVATICLFPVTDDVAVAGA